MAISSQEMAKGAQEQAKAGAYIANQTAGQTSATVTVNADTQVFAQYTGGAPTASPKTGWTG